MTASQPPPARQPSAQRAPVLKSALNPGYGTGTMCSVKSVGPVLSSARLGSSLTGSLLPAQETMLHGARLSVLGAGRPSTAPLVANGKPAAMRQVNSAGGGQILQLLKRAPG